MTNEAYFENVLEYGDLYLDKVFNDFEDENIIFTCKDNNANYFLAVCYEFRYKLEWVLCKTDAISLIELISKKIDLHTMFKVSNKLINIVTDMEGDHITEVVYDKFNTSFLPTPGLKLKPNFDLTYYFFDLYIRNIKPEPMQTTYFIKFNLNVASDEILHATDSNTFKFKYDINYTTCSNPDEFSKVNLIDAA